MRIATWNINGVRARIDGATAWAREVSPDILLLQEIKSEDAVFPAEAFEDLGYNVAVHGQKGFNGVTVLSKLPIDEARPGLPGDDGDDQARFLDITVSVAGTALHVASLYLPNGNPTGSDKFTYKLAWMERLRAFVEARLAAEDMFVLGGDFNVILEPRDARFPERWADDALNQPESRAAFRRLQHLGLTDTFRACDDSDGQYTFWDYQAGAWQKDNGIRIDYLLASPLAADRLTGCAIDKRTRAWEKPSDHVPVMAEFAL